MFLFALKIFNFLSLLMTPTSYIQTKFYLKSPENVITAELQKLYIWLTSNKLSLNIVKSNFVIFHSYQKKLPF